MICDFLASGVFLGQSALIPLRREGSRGDVIFPRFDPGTRQPAAHTAGKVRFRKGLLRREAFLTALGQLDIEPYCLALTKVHTFGPTFRPETTHIDVAT